MIVRCAGLALIAFGLIGVSTVTHDAAAQVSPTQQQPLAQAIPFDCLDRCFAEFKTCLGTPPNDGRPVIIPNGRSGTVPTPPPFDLCKRIRDECDAACVPPPTR